MPQQKFNVQVTTLPDCDDITRFDGTQPNKVPRNKENVQNKALNGTVLSIFRVYLFCSGIGESNKEA